MPGRWIGRLLAPLALIVCAAAVLLVVRATLADEQDPASRRPAPRSTADSGTSTTQRTASPRRKTYVVRSGDVLSTIAERTGVSVERILRLNPRVDPQSLRTGQRLRLRS